MSKKKKFLYIALILILTSGGYYLGSIYRSNITHIQASRKAYSTDKFKRALVSTTNSIANVPASEYFLQLAGLLKDNYVDPINITDKYAMSAIKSMISYLADPNSQFMDKDQFANYLDTQKGLYQGIGVETMLYFTPEQLKHQKDEDNAEIAVYIPSLIVTAVAPASSAAKAGMLPGDQISSVDNKWLLSYKELLAFRAMQQKFLEKKITGAQLDAARKEISAKLKKSITPQKARELLIFGKTGSVKLRWERNNKTFESTISRQSTKVPAISKTGPVQNTIQLRFFDNTPQEFKSYLKNSKGLIIDLRNSGRGNFQKMEECLELLVPKGIYGNLVQQGRRKPFVIKNGNPHPPKIKVIVDSTTTGAASIFANVLTSGGFAAQQGKTTFSDLPVVQVFSIKTDDAGMQGYTLTTHLFEFTGTKKGGSK